MQIALALFVIVTTLFLWRGFALKSIPGFGGSVAVGAASGLFNGAFGIGGPPVILFYFSSPQAHAVGRASVIAFFFATDTIGLAMLARESLVTFDTAYRALAFAIPLVVGIWLGARAFKKADPAVFRKIVLILLSLLAALTAVKGLYGVMA